ncbi:DUF3173 family protein [Streptococcus agalactiae]|uniref:DUF3173 domain-containing protein n=1 Tax=Streptococcus agalactiae MRI Z1-216 TaxID=1154879 RepID=A0AAD3A4T6_STRAG|nr:DUF3173 family protein [Streptococcus agalactiae]EPU34935.1 hypothetical protein SAG0162_01895 [Streptococcus agalactiae MRI Z1-214]EPU36175.1 hypothetical protein SAG0161_09755 [Streptococcus agalactiae MRI Z1-213]EPU43183.1 hypothetical protein SAG0164_11670 [Streptococcus agalactiae MRI Z1-216]EPX09761.1 hypothetical protein SAG0165_08785 [Streptococcus agalactiae MRI Z1-217]MCC9675242.1 DUF3173 family protein [Streptococcus agalactiae]
MEKSLITKDDLIEQGLKEGTARKVIHEAKITLVSQGFKFYNNRRLGAVPISIVEKILNVKF